MKKEAERLAQLVLKNNWDGSLPVDPVFLSNKYGLDVIVDQLPDGVSGALVKTAEMVYPVILVDETEPRTRRRFTVAHELGHYIYNSLVNPPKEDNYRKIDFRDNRSKSGSDPEEIFANNFAATLLMPKDAIDQIDISSSGWDGMMYGASIMGVSIEALKFRMKNISKNG